MPKKINSKIKAVIFDMDGVIVDSEPIESSSLEILLAEYGKKAEFNEVGLVHTVGLAKDIYKNLIEKYNLIEDLEILKKRKGEIFSDLVKKNLVPIPDFFQLIKNLKKEKIKIGLASNRFIDLVFIMIEKIKAKEVFDVIVGITEGINPKPAPDIFLETASQLKVLPSACLVIEDSGTGVIAGKAAGMKVIAIPNKYTKYHDFSKADRIVGSLSEITLSFLRAL